MRIRSFWPLLYLLKLFYLLKYGIHWKILLWTVVYLTLYRCIFVEKSIFTWQANFMKIIFTSCSWVPHHAEGFAGNKSGFEYGIWMPCHPLAVTHLTHSCSILDASNQHNQNKLFIFFTAVSLLWCAYSSSNLYMCVTNLQPMSQRFKSDNWRGISYGCVRTEFYRFWRKSSVCLVADRWLLSCLFCCCPLWTLIKLYECIPCHIQGCAPGWSAFPNRDTMACTCEL